MRKFFGSLAIQSRVAVGALKKVWSSVSYMYLRVSGFFYMAALIPSPFRHVLLVVMTARPSYETIRAGLFGPVSRTYYDIPRLSVVLAGITLFRLLGLRDVRRYVVNK